MFGTCSRARWGVAVLEDWGLSVMVLTLLPEHVVKIVEKILQ